MPSLAESAVWRCPRCGPSVLRVDRTRRRKTLVYYGGPCECRRSQSRADGYLMNLAWRREIEEVHILYDEGVLLLDGSVRWHETEFPGDLDEEATRPLREDIWCKKCKENDSLEPEPPFEEEDERHWLSSEVELFCPSCRVEVPHRVEHDDPASEDLKLALDKVSVRP